jgi:Na+-transporting methylmalonyl-CoA/oxaloacetate decarboxylase gamma subunit
VNISSNNYLYKLHKYLVEKSFIKSVAHYKPGYFDYKIDEYIDSGYHIPKDLCSFINKLLFYFLVQVPLITILGFTISFAGILNPIIFIFTKGWNWMDNGQLVLAILTLLIYIIYTLSFLVYSFEKYIKQKRNYAFLSKVNKNTFECFSIVREYISNKHEKICVPIIIIEEKSNLTK